MSNSRNKLLNDVDASMLWQAIKEATAQKTYALKINLNRVPSVFDSKVGGLPYWDLNVPIPRTSDGKKMALLAQLNMADYPDNDLLPKEGMLQFFIGASDVYGLNFDDQTLQEGFRVVFHEEIDRSFSSESIKGEFILPHDSNDDDLPIASEYALDVEQKVAYMFHDDYRFDGVIKSVAQSIGLRNRPEYANLTDKEFYRILWDSLEPIFEENEESYEFVMSGSRVLGYPFFTQSDPREVQGKYSGYDILLLQLDSEDRKLSDDSYDWMVMWGDCGVGNFFIRKEDLLNKDFSHVLYNWDCF
ncbi:MAG: DUF1963 domain-containing protein [Alphaproteobacteria bacterium]|nr:DUF1963 domain-containing protein [Alphaproteobacteria bacterium]